MEGEITNATRRAQGARPRGVRHPNSLRVSRGRPCPLSLRSYPWIAHSAKTRLRVGVFSGIILGLVFLTRFCGTAIAENKSTTERLGRLQEQLDSVKVQLEFLKLKVSDTRAHVRRLESQSNRKLERVAVLRTETAALASETAEAAERIERLSKEIAEGTAKSKAIRSRFRNRLVQLHKIRQGTLVTSIFSAGDLNSFLNRFQMVRHLLESDRKLLEALRSNHAKLVADGQALIADRKHLEELSATNDKRQKELTVEMSSLAAILETLVLERKVFVSRQEKLKQGQQALEQEIAKIESSRSRNQTGFDAGISESTRPGPFSPTNENPAEPSIVAPASGSVAANPRRLVFQWPMKKVQLLSFQPTGEGTPPGLEIVVSGETEIVAAALGKILFKGPLGQFGNVIIIGHKKGFSSVYGNLDDTWVGVGQIVEQGEVIGRMLGARNTRLHFEIRFAGRNEDPLSFLPKPR